MDDEDIARLHRATSADLRRFVARRLPDAAEVDDVVGECGLILWRRRRSVPDDPNHARRWLFQVAKHVVANTRRSSARRIALGRRLRTEATERTCEIDDAAAGVVDAFAGLDPDDRRVLVLAALGLRGADLAAALGCSTAAAASRLSRARRRLAD